MDLALRALTVAVTSFVLASMAPPVNTPWVHWVIYVPIFWALRPGERRNNALLGWLFGTIQLAVIFVWLVDTITLFSNIPLILTIGILLLFSSVFGAPWAFVWSMVHPLRERFGSSWILAFPALVAAVEYLSQFILLFPYTQGLSQHLFPWTWQLPSLTGMWGLTFLLIWVNSCWAESVYRRAEGREDLVPVGWVGAALGTLGAVFIYGAWWHEHVEATLRAAPTLRLGQLQSRKGMDIRLSRPAQEGFQDWMRMSKSLPDVDLVVWPEGACPFSLSVEEGKRNRARDVVGKLAREGSFELVVGGGSRRRQPDASMGEDRVRVFNSVYWFLEDGTVLDSYDKMVPLPFGEYLPFSDYLPGLADAIGGIGDFKAGTEPKVFQSPLAAAATPICYEAILPGLCRSYDAPTLLINVTNDAWFGDTKAPWQHAVLASIRSVELGVPMIRSAYTGTSMVVEPHGERLYETVPFEDVTRVVTVRLGTVTTPYSVLGDWLPWSCILGLAIGWVATRNRESSASQQ